jgi:hypothetical protein
MIPNIFGLAGGCFAVSSALVEKTVDQFSQVKACDATRSKPEGWKVPIDDVIYLGNVKSTAIGEINGNHR